MVDYIVTCSLKENHKARGSSNCVCLLYFAMIVYLLQAADGRHNCFLSLLSVNIFGHSVLYTQTVCSKMYGLSCSSTVLRREKSPENLPLKAFVPLQSECLKLNVFFGSASHTET